ncbi:MAG: hypothetical protein HQL42_05420 [Alphaproteobacteria bacterium]|nr:hypothetical protein [Alphaproteobacteria bacterium]
MSHIDSFRHAQVGSLAGIPVYLSLEDIDGDFRCPSHSLIIGGGSGEHPAATLSDPLRAVAFFVVTELPSLKLRPTVRAQWTQACQPFLTQTDKPIVTYFDWLPEDHDNFRASCRSPLLENSYAICADDMEFDDWLALGLGEFIFFAMPKLAAPLMAQLEGLPSHFRHLRYSNILLRPPNVPTYANGGNAFDIIVRY